MTEVIVRYHCDGCHIEKRKEELTRVQVNVWRRDSRGVYLDPQFRLFCDKCEAERKLS